MPNDYPTGKAPGKPPFYPGCVERMGVRWKLLPSETVDFPET